MSDIVERLNLDHSSLNRLHQEAAEEITRLRIALAEAEKKGGMSPFEIVAEWHDKQASRLKDMSKDVRSGELGMAKAADASKFHAGSAAALRLKVIKDRQLAVPVGEQ